MNRMLRLVRRRWRTLAAGAAGLGAGLLAAGGGLAVGVSGLIGWNVAAVLFLAPTWFILLFDPAAKLRERAALEDENRAVLMSLVITAVATSLAGVVLALHQSKTHGGHSALVAALSVSTLIFNWLIVQSQFALHYAHRYFGDGDNDGSADQGFEFQGSPPETYRDFVYVAICVGATCQVSDFNLTSAKFRNLVTCHAVIAFFFNTMVLALGINIIGNLMGQ